MKATFGSVEVEGTPEEMADLIRLTQGINVEPITVPVVPPYPYYTPYTPWWLQPSIVWCQSGASGATTTNYLNKSAITNTGTEAVTMP